MVETDLHIFVLVMRYSSWSCLDSTCPCYAGDYAVGGECLAKGFFVSDAVLNYDECCVVVGYGGEEGWCGRGFYGFVAADYEVEGLGRGF